MSYETEFDVAVKTAGGAKAIADELGESVQTVSNWRTRGVPANRCKAFEALTGMSVRRLRPKDWREYWPDAAKAHA